MAHELEMKDGKALMSYVGEVPWHGLGTKVDADISAENMMKAAGLDWQVKVVPTLFRGVDKKMKPTGGAVLIRPSDDHVLDTKVSAGWVPVQNSEAFAFFHDFVEAGSMEMHTAGSIKDGRIVWALAKIKDPIVLFKKDVVESFLLFSTFHQYGKATTVALTNTRVVCNNTMQMALGEKKGSEKMIRVAHHKAFNPDVVKDTLKIAQAQQKDFQKAATFLGTKKASQDDLVRFFGHIFSASGEDIAKFKAEDNKLVVQALDLIDKQPGHDIKPGTWWQAYNTVTFMTNHVMGHRQETRLESLWYGINRRRNDEAMTKALEMATAS